MVVVGMKMLRHDFSVEFFWALLWAEMGTAVIPCAESGALEL